MSQQWVGLSLWVLMAVPGDVPVSAEDVSAVDRAVPVGAD